MVNTGFAKGIVQTANFTANWEPVNKWNFANLDTKVTITTIDRHLVIDTPLILHMPDHMQGYRYARIQVYDQQASQCSTTEVRD